MDAEALGRRSLALDAAYCAVVGSTAMVARRRVAPMLGASPTSIGIAAGLTLTWAGVVASIGRRPAWRGPVAVVAAANVLASTVLGVGALRQERAAGRWILIGVTGEVAAFAATQVAALRA